MKLVLFVAVIGLIPLFGCSTRSVTVAAVGPSPIESKTRATTGQLQVFSSVVREHDDQSLGNDGGAGWNRHTPYSIYSPDGRLIARVENSVGHYANKPELYDLPAGNYLVKAQAKNYDSVSVPVRVAPGETTQIHLDGKWSVPSGLKRDEVVSTPDGNIVGWRATGTSAN